MVCTQASRYPQQMLPVALKLEFGWQFRIRDKVIQTENNYDKDVFNGDIGQITKIDLVEKEVIVAFDQRKVSYDFGELDELALAYVVSILDLSYTLVF